MDSVSLTAAERVALDGLASELRRVFAARLHSVAVYGLHAPAASPRLLHTLALVERLSFEDLAACAPFAPGWRRRNLAVPLILEREEFLRTLDIFPLEYGDIVAHHVLVAGADPFADARISPAGRVSGFHSGQPIFSNSWLAASIRRNRVLPRAVSAS